MSKRYLKTTTYLFTIIKNEGESLGVYVKRFIQGVYEVPHLNHGLLVGIMWQNLCHGGLRNQQRKIPEHDLGRVVGESRKYICIEEAI